MWFGNSNLLHLWCTIVRFSFQCRVLRGLCGFFSKNSDSRTEVHMPHEQCLPHRTSYDYFAFFKFYYCNCKPHRNFHFVSIISALGSEAGDLIVLEVKKSRGSYQPYPHSIQCLSKKFFGQYVAKFLANTWRKKKIFFQIR